MATRFRIAYLENGIKVRSAQTMAEAESKLGSICALRAEVIPLGIHHQGEDELRYTSDFAAKLNVDSLTALLNHIKSTYYNPD